MKNHKNTTPICPVIAAAVVENVNTLTAAIYVPPSSCYAKLPRLPDGGKRLAAPRERW